MSNVNTDTQATPKFNAEAFAMNIARAMESSGQSARSLSQAAPRRGSRDKPPNELGEVIKTFSVIAEYWLSDKERASSLQMQLGKDYLDLWGAAVRRMAGEADAKPAIAPAPRDKRFRTRNGSRTSSSISSFSSIC